ncbi:Ku70/Ku80 N-terminal alpha/beta domain-containing protein [Microdochium trichocladiopsis]|uniref:ATP-dependent DNA helicase II subunit 2 n=1 Tax=Microdochium trichocladiopsis TaxID=1682393 RepID=A0A9P8YLH7_9PEZI|nr:Ku70/Ku80 N-terminal alpha/beta domain-containing protein [Microdochium trichocladiopsis]KAH7041199.1 Ku70/Ku80 N-terminal alpha/beta domain-containing protein [Microdochium trichocladiopsis]
MADKEAVVYIVDLGESMGDCHNGRVESDLDWSMRFVWDKISTTVAASRKTWNVGVLGLRTDETNNPLQGDDGYENISVLQDLGPMNMTDLQTLRSKIKPSSTTEGDSISAIVVAVDMIAKLTKKLKYKRKIYLVTDGEAPVDGDDFDDIAAKIKDTGIELTILGVDFDDADFGVKEEDKSHHKAQNEKLLRELADKCDGQFGTVEEAVSFLDVPRLKVTRPYKTYDGPLTLGDPEVHPDAMSISVERYFKVHKATIPPASRVVVKDEPSGEGDAMEGIESTTEFAAVKNARTYKVNDPSAPGGKRDVEFESLAKGYQYGSTAVHISEAEFNITKIETTRGFSIVGFIQQDKFEPFLNMGEAGLTVAQKFNDAAALKLSSFIHALHELESYAVARLVTKDGKEPVLVLLAPHIDVDFECLYDVPLPFAEDVRHYKFPPLDKVVTLTGQTLSEHKQLLPSTELQEVMDDYVDSMDISTWEPDDDGERTQEYAPVEDVFCPPLHRINQVVRHRAIHTDQPVPPVPEILLKYSQPPADLVEKARLRLDDLIETACVKKVPPKARGKRDRADRGVKPISGLDVAALLKQDPSRKKLDPSNAVPQFKQMIEVSESMSQVEDAAKQMGGVIRDLVSDSLGNSGYDQAMEDLGVFRAQMIEMEEPEFYNSFVMDLKKRLLAGELGGDRRELWWQMKGAKLGLIDETQSEQSKVTTAEAIEFYK